MPLFVFIGTHLPEIRECLRHLQQNVIRQPVRLLWPSSLAFENAPENVQVNCFDGCQNLPDFADLDTETTFLFIDPRRFLLEEIYDLADHMALRKASPTRIITCVDTLIASQSTALRNWLEAAIYYSDVVLLGNRSETAKSFVRDYQQSFAKRCYPTVFQLLKKNGRPENPEVLFDPDPRRLSLLFDLPEEEAENDAEWIVESSCDLDTEDASSDPFLSQEGDLLPLPEILDCIVNETP
jgi:hypothetical protein